MKVCLAASAGGHLTQLLRLRDAYEPHTHFFVTSSEVVADNLNSGESVYVVGEANRQQPLALVSILLRVTRVMFRERPQAVLSTGAAPGCLACLVGWMLGARIIWVDSVANTEKLSLSARIVRPVASAVLSQWPHVADRHRGVEYAGNLL